MGMVCKMYFHKMFKNDQSMKYLFLENLVLYSNLSVKTITCQLQHTHVKFFQLERLATIEDYQKQSKHCNLKSGIQPWLVVGQVILVSI